MTAAVVLGRCDLALLSDLSQRVTIPHLTAAPQSRKYPGVTVQFAGDTFPTAFRGASRAKSWAMTAMYMQREQDRLQALLTLVEVAADLPDSRLLLRTNYGQSIGLDDSAAVVIFEIDPAPQMGLYANVSFTCEAVEFTLAG